jgi:N-acetylmuramoyl-L-alanine amidase
MNRATRTGLWIVLLGLWWVTGALSVARAEVTLSSAGQQITIRSVERKTGLYVSAIELFEALGGRLHWDNLAKSLSVDLADHQWLFYLFSPFVGVDGDPYNLMYPVRYDDGDILVPLVPLVPVLDSAHPQRVIWEAKSRTLIIETEKFNLIEYAVHEKKNGLLLELILRRPLKFEAFASEGNWLNITLEEGRLDPAVLNRRNRRGLVREVKAFQFAESAQISFRFARNLGPFVTATATMPDRIQILYEDSTYFPDYPVPDEAQVSTAPDPIDLIVIDPGHGGRDPGAIGRRKSTREKDIVLKIAAYLKELIDRDDRLQAVMTRNGDHFVPLEERARIANDAGADLFISIHANASPRSRPCGCQTFFLAHAKNDDARAVAQLENAALQYEDRRPDDTSVVDFILLDMIQTEFQRESADLAELVQEEFEKYLKIPSRGVDQAGFVVLNKAYMPSVLVETAFISNAKEEKELRKKSFQKNVAKAIYRSILAFKARYDPAY